ncbi:MAG TPA: PilZ domain-containing protein [Verrucomicrobiae bacterium]|jgi:hypothetical protein|nr:PilZ domain-containing protein [Verrucomicrobiae bacterium]
MMNQTLDTVETVEEPKASKATGAGVLNAPPSSQTRQERRRQKRAKVKLAARVRPADLRTGDCHEVLITVNASRQNLYFITVDERYSLGMRLLVTFPYDFAHDTIVASEEVGEVTRTERLPDGRIGVAVRLGNPGRAEGTVADRRITTRQPFSSEALVADSDGSIRLRGRCTDLSPEGCYVDTLNPLPTGTIARVELRKADRVFEAVARVNSSHMGMGMGLCFQDLTPDQISVLMNWLSKEPGGRMWVANPLDSTKREESTDRALAIDLIRHILSKGILTKADLTDIFHNSGII